MALTDLAVAGNQQGQLKLHALLNRGWIERHDGFMAGVQGLPAPPFNAVTVYAECPRGELVDALGRVRSAGLPFSLSARPGAYELAASIAQQFGMVAQAGMPLMGLTDVPPEPAIEGLTLRRLSGAENELHAAIAAQVFEAPLELTLVLAQPEMMTGHGGHFIGADYAGKTVATAVADVNAEAAWIFNVATLAEYRGRGIGSAVTAAAARAAFAAGATAVFLLSSPMGERVYENLGFRRLEWWSAWEGFPPA